MQTVKNKTTVLKLVFKEFLQISTPPLISVLYAKGYHDFPLKIFLRTVPKNFVEEPVCLSEKFVYRKILCRRGDYHNFPKKIFCLTVPKNFVVEPFFFSKFLLSKKILYKRWEGGSITIFCQIFLSHTAESFHRETLQCVAKFGYRKIIRFRELCHAVVLTFFCLKVPKTFVEAPFWSVFQNISGIEKLYGKEGLEGESRFSVNFFCLTVTKHFVGEPFNVSLISGMERFYASESYVTILCRRFFFSQCLKIS